MSSTRISGDPLGESDLLVALQKQLTGKPGVLPTARGMSHFGEHALGWMGSAALGYGLAAAQGKPADGPERRGWLTVGVSAFLAHAASVVLKRIIRRPRPHDPRIKIGVGTPSKLSFPSSHATSSTAALVAFTQSANNRTGTLPLVGIPAMALSRMVLGVHYPSDVALGSCIGAATAIAVGRVIDGGRGGVTKKNSEEKSQ